MHCGVLLGVCINLMRSDIVRKLRRSGGAEFFDAEVAVADGFFVVVVLETDVTAGGAGGGIGPGGDEFAIEANGIILIARDDFVVVPLAGRLGGIKSGGLKWIDGAGVPGGIAGFGIAEFDFVAALDGVPWIVAGIWEANEDAGIGSFLFLKEFAADNKVGVSAIGKPPEAHAAFASGDAIFECESARARLLPGDDIFAAEKIFETVVVFDGRGDEIEIFAREFADYAGLGIAIEKFGGFGLKLNFAAFEWMPAFVVFVTRIDGDEVGDAVENVDAIAVPENDFDSVPVAKDVFRIEGWSDAIFGSGGNEGKPTPPDDVFLAGAFFFVRDVQFHVGLYEFAFDIDDRAVDAPPLADAFFHDVVFDGSHPAGTRIGLIDAAIENAAVASHVGTGGPALFTPLELYAEMEIGEFGISGDGTVNFAGDMDRGAVCEIGDAKDVFGVFVGHDIGVVGASEVFGPAGEIAVIEEIDPVGGGSGGRWCIGGAQEDG